MNHRPMMVRVSFQPWKAPGMQFFSFISHFGIYRYFSLIYPDGRIIQYPAVYGQFFTGLPGKFRKRSTGKDRPAGLRNGIKSRFGLAGIADQTVVYSCRPGLIEAPVQCHGTIGLLSGLFIDALE